MISHSNNSQKTKQKNHLTCTDLKQPEYEHEVNGLFTQTISAERMPGIRG